MAPVTQDPKSHHLPTSAEMELPKPRIPEESDDEVDLIYNRLINEAPYVASDQVEFQPCRSSDMTWIDPALVLAGQQFVSRNFFSLICAHLGALLYGFSFKSLSTFLLRTGNSSSVELSLVRYLSTFMHLKTWYESSIMTSASEGYADVQRVKKMHLLALKQYKREPIKASDLDILNKDIENPGTRAIMDAVRNDLSPISIKEVPYHLFTYFPVVGMSQFDMVMTQFGVISLVYLFPAVLGISNDQGLDGFLHLWAIIGKLLGIHDRFNLALYPSYRLYHKIFMNIGIGSLKDSDLIVIHLQEVLIKGVAKYAHYTTHKSLLYFGLSRNNALINFKGNQLRKLLNWKDVACYWLMRILLGSVYTFPMVRIGVNWTARRALAQASAKYLTKGNKSKTNLLRENNTNASIFEIFKIFKNEGIQILKQTVTRYFLVIGTTLLIFIAII